MKSWVNGVRALFCLLAMCLFTTRSEAVILESTSNVTFNTTAPTGVLTNSGWQYEGFWQGSYLATPIAPTFFLAAIHIGGSVGDALQFNGSPVLYHTVAVTNCPNSDLCVWQVAETFPSYAPLYTGSNEVGQLCVVFGRGTQRGDAVTVNSQLKGWKWGPTDGVQRWGENIVATIDTEPGLGDLLKMNFDRNGVTNECMLSVGDSSGGVFIENDGVWKLAGINYGVDGPLYSLNGTTNTEFDGAIMDLGGLYIATNSTPDWEFFPDQVNDIVTGFYSSRISPHVAWINSVINFLSGYDLQISNVVPVGADIHINLATGSNRFYLVQSTTDLVTGTWTTVTSNLAGNGGIVTIIDTNAATQPERFYRVQPLPQ